MIYVLGVINERGRRLHVSLKRDIAVYRLKEGDGLQHYQVCDIIFTQLHIGRRISKSGRAAEPSSYT